MKPQFTWSDVWLLTSIAWTDQSRGANLTDLIAVGDYINHAIFSAVELRRGLAKLSYSGYILERESRFFLHGPAQELSEAHQGKPPPSLSKLTKAFYKLLDVEPPPAGQAVTDDYDWQYPGITDDAVEKAYQEYIAEFEEDS